MKKEVNKMYKPKIINVHKLDVFLKKIEKGIVTLNKRV